MSVNLEPTLAAPGLSTVPGTIWLNLALRGFGGAKPPLAGGFAGFGALSTGSMFFTTGVFFLSLWGFAAESTASDDGFEAEGLFAVLDDDDDDLLLEPRPLAFDLDELDLEEEELSFLSLCCCFFDWATSAEVELAFDFLSASSLLCFLELDLLLLDLLPLFSFFLLFSES